MTYTCESGFQIQIDFGNCVGRGAAGKVFSGIGIPNGENCVVKLVRACDPALQRELDVLRACCEGDSRSENLHKYFGDFGIAREDESYRAIVLEKVGDTTLENMLRSEDAVNVKTQIRGDVTMAGICRIMIRIAVGVEDIHSAGYAVSDIGLENILISKEGNVETVKLIDFGRAVPVSNGGSGRNDFGGGVWELMPAVQHDGIVSISTDLQTLGALLLMLLAGEAPFYPGDVVFRRACTSSISWEEYKAECKRQAKSEAHLNLVLHNLVQKRQAENAELARALGEVGIRACRGGYYTSAAAFYKAIEKRLRA